MRSWFGKAGNGVYVCVIMKENSDPDQTKEPLGEAHEAKFKKRTDVQLLVKQHKMLGL